MAKKTRSIRRRRKKSIRGKSQVPLWVRFFILWTPIFAMIITLAYMIVNSDDLIIAILAAFSIDDLSQVSRVKINGELINVGMLVAIIFIAYSDDTLNRFMDMLNGFSYMVAQYAEKKTKAASKTKKNNKLDLSKLVIWAMGFMILSVVTVGLTF